VHRLVELLQQRPLQRRSLQVQLMMGRPALPPVALAALVAACSTYQAQPAVSDAGGSRDATVDASGVPSNLLTNGGFESSSGTTCAPDWAPVKASTTTDANARSGARSCKVCNTGSNEDFGVVTASLPFAKGQWVLQAHVRRPEGGTPANAGTLKIEFNAANGNYAGDEDRSVVLGADWGVAQLSATRTDDEPATVKFVVGGVGPTGACLLVDDVVVERF
jgi:hypothetical protein